MTVTNTYFRLGTPETNGRYSKDKRLTTRKLSEDETRRNMEVLHNLFAECLSLDRMFFVFHAPRPSDGTFQTRVCCL